MRPSDIVILVILAALTAFVIYRLMKGPAPSTGCGGGCEGCPHKGGCGSVDKQEQEKK